MLFYIALAIALFVYVYSPFDKTSSNSTGHLIIPEEIEVEPPQTEEDQLFMIVEDQPEFPGGEEKMYSFLYNNIKYPNAARLNRAEGKVVVSFVVDRNGQISDVHILRDIGYGCGEEAIRIIKMMPPWKPGKQRGKPVRTQFNIPVQFTLK